MAEIEYTFTDAQGLELIAPLWNKLLQHHAEHSTYFSKQMVTMTYEKRKSQLVEKSREGVLRIELAYDISTGKLIGYCVSTINAGKQGEIESIYVEADYRRSGIADTMLKKCLDWMDEMSVEKKIIVVAVGNEEVIPLYEKYNFYPRVIVLEQLEDK